MATKFEYGKSYLLKMLRQNSGSAKEINTKRWDFIKEICPEVKTVLDYGCGCNYLSAFAPEDVEVDSYDIGEYCGVHYPQTGITRDNYEVACFFDSLEHVDWKESLDSKMLYVVGISDYVIVSVPILPPGKSLDETWRHYKPTEHLTYFTESTLEKFFNDLGFELVTMNAIECPPRCDITTFAFKKNIPSWTVKDNAR